MRKLNPSYDPKNSSIFLGSSKVGRRGRVRWWGQVDRKRRRRRCRWGRCLYLRGEKGGGEAGGGMRAEDSDGAVRRVTTSKELRAEAVMLDMRQISKKARQKV